MKRHIPNFITSLNLVSGFIAIIIAAKGNVVAASWFIVAAMLFDFLDGFSARLLNAYSDIGKELDSLADVVSFGVAPAIIIYYYLEISLSAGTDTAGFSMVMLIPAIMPVCGALRLAIFNLDSSQATSFKGLPIPANAIAVISLALADHYSDSEFISSLAGSPVFLILLTVILSLLMVSRIDLFSLKIKDIRFKGNEARYLMIVAILTLLIIFGIQAAVLIIPVYIITSLLSRFL